MPALRSYIQVFCSASESNYDQVLGRADHAFNVRCESAPCRIKNTRLPAEAAPVARYRFNSPCVAHLSLHYSFRVVEALCMQQTLRCEVRSHGSR